jgi:hypothetical protein
LRIVVQAALVESASSRGKNSIGTDEPDPVDEADRGEIVGAQEDAADRRGTPREPGPVPGVVAREGGVADRAFRERGHDPRDGEVVGVVGQAGRGPRPSKVSVACEYGFPAHPASAARARRAAPHASAPDRNRRRIGADHTRRRRGGSTAAGWRPGV